MDVYSRIDECELSSDLFISIKESTKDKVRTHNIGSPAVFMIVALNGLWVCKNCLVIVDNRDLSSSAKLSDQLPSPTEKVIVELTIRRDSLRLYV